MGTSRDNGLFLGSSASHDVDKTADARPEVKEPKNKPILNGSADEPDSKRDLWIPGIEFPARRRNLAPDLERWQDHCNEEPTAQYCRDEQHQWPIASERYQALASRWHRGARRRVVELLMDSFAQNAPRLLCN